MKRITDEFLSKWKSDLRRKPLLIRGARQVGKTYSITQFGRKEFENYIKIDFEKEPMYRQIFEKDLNPQRICSEIGILKNTRFQQGKTLLFLDEIQECPKAIISLRYFYEEMPDLHVVASGSLLEFALSEVSFPVGRIQIYNMFPLNFVEFLNALGKDQLSELIVKGPHSMSDTIHEMLIGELRKYFFTGGMPESVKVFCDTASLIDCFEVQNEIVNTLRMDFSKYTPKVDRDCLNSALSEIAISAGKQTKYSKLAEGFSNPTLKKAYHTLLMARLINQISAINPIGFPPQIASSRVFKTSLLDIGLMNYLGGISASEEYLKTDLLAIYRGAMAEQFVAQELAISQQNNLYYWQRMEKSSTAEIDFVIQKHGAWYPVEVKSGSSGSLRSIHQYFSKFKDCKEAFILSSRVYSELPEQKLKFIPLYFAGYL